MHRAPVAAWCLAALIASVSGSAPRAAGADQSGQAVPERATPRLAIDFVVVSRDGTPVDDLRADEIALRIGNRARPVRWLQQVSSTGMTRDDAGGTEPLPAPFGTNARDDEGRTLVLAVDSDSFRPGREAPLREAVEHLLQGLTRRDRLALVTMPYGGIKVPFTTEHERVRSALAQIVGHAPSGETGSALACRTRETLTELDGFLNTLGVRQDPVTVMFVTAALAAPRRDAPVMLAPGMCELRAELFEQIGIAAGAARAQFYIIQPGDDLGRTAGVQRENIAGVGFQGSDNPIEGIEHLAGVTGGKMLQLTGSAETALGRVLRETSVRYVAAIDPDRNDATGRSQQLELRVNRPGVDVRASRHITFPSPEPALGRRADPSPRDMLAVPTVFRDLPLRATAFTPVQEDGKALRVIMLAEPVEPGVTFGSVMAALFDADGAAAAQWVATAAELAQLPVVGAMQVPAGAYRLRVAAIDTTGRAGTADYHVAADVASTGPLKLSSIVLELSRDGAFLPRLQFTNEPSAIGYVEMVGAAAGTPVNATLEVARTLNGPALLAVPLAIEATGENRYVARGAIPIGALPPGDYIVRALVGAEGHPMTRVVRTLRKAAVKGS